MLLERGRERKKGEIVEGEVGEGMERERKRQQTERGEINLGQQKQ